VLAFEKGTLQYDRVQMSQLDRAAGIRKGPRLTAWLREQRTRGNLICTSEGRLQSLVVHPDGRRERCYIFTVSTVPRARGRVKRL
jgi:16S rRNA U516 pseudouridylate synthase RsuA-like enzyme